MDTGTYSKFQPYELCNRIETFSSEKVVRSHWCVLSVYFSTCIRNITCLFDEEHLAIDALQKIGGIKRNVNILNIGQSNKIPIDLSKYQKI